MLVVIPGRGDDCLLEKGCEDESLLSSACSNRWRSRQPRSETSTPRTALAGSSRTETTEIVQKEARGGVRHA